MRRLADERESLASEKRRSASEKRGLENRASTLEGKIARVESERDEAVAALGSLSVIPAGKRETLAAIPDLEHVLEDCIVCHDCLLKDIGEVSFGVMSYRCACTGETPRKMHVNCIVSMSDLSCPWCQSPITIIAPSLMTERRVHRLNIAKAPDAQGDADDAARRRARARGSVETSLDEALFAERVSAATARLRRQISQAPPRASNPRGTFEAFRARRVRGASNRGEPSAASHPLGSSAGSHREETSAELAARASAQIEAFIREYS